MGIDDQADSNRRHEGLAVAAAVLLGALVALGVLLWLDRDPGSVEAIADSESAPGAGAEPSGDEQTDEGASLGSESLDGTEGDLDGETDGSTDGSLDADRSEDNRSEDETGDEEQDPPVEGVDCPAGTIESVCEAVSFVEQVRGRAFRFFPPVELLSDADFDRELLADIDDYRDEIDTEAHLLKSLGLLDPELDLFDLYLDLLGSGVVGFYDPETDRMVVRGEELNLYGQLVLVHELAHAFDDQWHDLDREDFVHLDAEYSFAAVVEGNASRVEDAWRRRLSAAEANELAQQELSALSPEDLQTLYSLPPVVLEMQISPYTDGQVYIESLLRQGGEAAVDAALEEPPLTSETILRPGVSNDQLGADEPVSAPTTAGTLLDEGQIGQFLIGLWLGPEAAEGWGEDDYRMVETGGDICTAVTLTGDTDRDVGEMERAATAWANRAEGRSAELVPILSEDWAAGVEIVGCYRPS